MERSKSFDTLSASCKSSANSNNNNNINNNNINSGNMLNTASHSGSNSSLNSSNINQTAMNLRKAMELRQTRLQKQQLHLSGSSDNIIALKAAVAAGVTLPPIFLPKTVVAAVAMRKNLLQRQHSTEYVDDIDFVADLEEEGEVAEDDEGLEDEYEEVQAPAMQHFERSTASVSTVTTVQQKRLLFQQKKPRSRNALQFNTSYPSLPTHMLATASHTSTHSDGNSSVPSAAMPITIATAITNSSKTRNSSSSSAISLDGRLKHEDSFDSATDLSSPTSRRHHFPALKRDNSTHSDSSRYSSVDSLLEARKPDPEAILINLGFGPGSEDVLSRIPKRFLKPSQVRGIDTDAFVKRLQLASTLADQSALGYRGLTGNPDIPPSTIVAKIMQRFEVNERKKSMGSVEHTIR